MYMYFNLPIGQGLKYEITSVVCVLEWLVQYLKNNNNNNNNNNAEESFYI